MGMFADLNDNIMYIAEKLITNQNLCKLLYYSDTNPLSKPNIDGSQLLFNNIFPQPKSSNSINDKRSILTYTFSNVKLTNTNYKFHNGKIIFNILVHLDCWKLDNGIRPLLITEEINNMFNELLNPDLCLGNVLLGDWVYREYSEMYCGYYCTFDIVNFN